MSTVETITLSRYELLFLTYVANVAFYVTLFLHSYYRTFAGVSKKTEITGIYVARRNIW